MKLIEYWKQESNKNHDPPIQNPHCHYRLPVQPEAEGEKSPAITGVKLLFQNPRKRPEERGVMNDYDTEFNAL